MQVNLEACINCNLCVRACREVQSNDVIGMANRGYNSKVILILMMKWVTQHVWDVENVCRHALRGH